MVQVGQKYARLTIVRQVESENWSTRWECRCDCGNVLVVIGRNLSSGNTKSCGCLRREKIAIARLKVITHGATGTAEHRIWLNLKYRCTAPNAPNRRYYSEQGVGVDERWAVSFEAFLADVGLRPSPAHSLDRWPDPNGNYEPGNVRWATPEEQARNRRDNVLVTIGDETHCVGAWEKIAGLKPETVRRRLKKGWPPSRLLEPIRKWEKKAA